MRDSGLAMESGQKARPVSLTIGVGRVRGRGRARLLGG